MKSKKISNDQELIQSETEKFTSIEDGVTTILTVIFIFKTLKDRNWIPFALHLSLNFNQTYTNL